ncbi:hypothetical protein K443DRAFT_255891, partial [Laccaria amethystina LaAM-08-1]
TVYAHQTREVGRWAQRTKRILCTGFRYANTHLHCTFCALSRTRRGDIYGGARPRLCVRAHAK